MIDLQLGYMSIIAILAVMYLSRSLAVKTVRYYYTSSEIYTQVCQQYSSIYDLGEKRTGCMFCMFGVHLEKGQNRFQRNRSSEMNTPFCLLSVDEQLKQIKKTLKLLKRANNFSRQMADRHYSRQKPGTSQVALDFSGKENSAARKA